MEAMRYKGATGAGWSALTMLLEFGFGHYVVGTHFGGSCSARIGSIIAHSSSDASQIGGKGALPFFGRPIATPPAQAIGRRVPV
jgi:hypothetical protein